MMVQCASRDSSTVDSASALMIKRFNGWPRLLPSLLSFSRSF